MIACRFEKLAGSATAKWHVSIKVLPSGTTIGKWLQQQGLPVLQVGAGRIYACIYTCSNDPQLAPQRCCARRIRVRERRGVRVLVHPSEGLSSFMHAFVFQGVLSG